jgi:hypothetical protein
MATHHSSLWQEGMYSTLEIIYGTNNIFANGAYMLVLPVPIVI